MEKAEGTELSRMLADETMIESFMLLVAMITKVMKGRSGASKQERWCMRMHHSFNTNQARSCESCV
jgi:hypothetical protein